MKKVFVIILFFLAISNIAHARRGSVMIVGYVNPEFRGHTISKVLVQVRNADFYFRDQIERRTESELEDESDNGVDAVQYHRTFPPIRKYSEEEIEDKIRKEAIDSVLFINIGKDKENVTTGWSFSVGHGGGSGGSYSNVYRYTYAKMELFDVKSKKLIWSGEGKFIAKGGSEKSYKRVSKYIAKKLVSQLEMSNLLAKPKSKAKKKKKEELESSEW